MKSVTLPPPSFQMSWSPSMSSGPFSPSYPPVSEQVKQVLLAISLAYDNFVEINGQRTSISEKGKSGSFGSTGTSFKSLSKDVIKFHRSIRKNRDKSKEFTEFTGSSSSSSSSSNRKRSWESEERLSDLVSPSNSPIQSPVQHTGKRSKSLVLTQELEGLCLSTNTNTQKHHFLFAEMDEWAEQDFNPSNNLGKIERFEDLKRELDSCNSGSIDEVLKILSSYTSNINTSSNNNNAYASNHSNNLSNHYMNHWIKWGVINEVVESLKSPEIPLKLLISRSLNLLAALNKISILLDWNDPEILFLLNKFLVSVTNPIRFKSNNSNNNNNCNNRNNINSRAVLGFIGISRILNLFTRLPLPPSTFQFLLSHQDTSNQVIEMLESSLDTILTIFEHAAASCKVVLSEGFDTFDLADCSVVLTLKIIEKFKLPENEEIIKELMTRIIHI